MATFLLPAGVAAVPRPFGVNEALLGSRVSSCRFELLDTNENLLGLLDAVEPESGSVKYAAYASVKSGGSITVTDIGNDIDWLNVRIRPVMTTGAVNIDGTDLDTRLGVYTAAAPKEDWSATGRSWNVELTDKTGLLDTDIATGDASGRVPYAAAAGSNVIELVRDIIHGVGEDTPALEPGTEVLTQDLVWDLTATRLKVINDLLDLAGYFSIYCDGAGNFRVDKYVRPEDRVPVYEALNPFSKSETSLMSPNWTRDRDIYAVPNRYILVSQGDGTNPGLVASATDTNPASPYSYANRGERWITRSETGVEAISQEVLDVMAARRLADAQSVTQTMEVQHAFLPDLGINKVIRFTNPDAGLDAARATVTNLEIPFDTTALCKSTIRVVAGA